jgi:hypothetical protein
VLIRLERKKGLFGHNTVEVMAPYSMISYCVLLEVANIPLRGISVKPSGKLGFFGGGHVWKLIEF